MDVVEEPSITEECDSPNPLIQFDGAKETSLVSKGSVTPEEFEDEEDVDFDDIDDRVILTSREEDKFMDSFYMWLKSVDGGLKPPRSSMQHKNVVMNILHFLDSSGRNYSKLFCRKDLNCWVSDYEARGRKPGTVKTYLGSVKLFYSFVLITKPDSISVESQKINQMNAIVTQWCRNYHKRIQIEKHNKQLEDLAKLPTPEEIRMLDTSDYKKEAIKTLSFLSVSKEIPSRKGYCLIRNYILTYVVLDNASRVGCISNMTLQEYNGTEVQPDGSYIITVKKHKTASTAGPAMLSITDIIMRHLKLFVERVRNQLPDIRTDNAAPVFASWGGNLMDTSLVCSAFNTFWKNCLNLDMERRITTTLCRKMTVTTVHQNAPDLRQDTANLMNHDLKTAQKEYFLLEKKKSVAATGARIRSLIRTDFNSDSKLREIFEDEIEKGQILIVDVREKKKSYAELKEWDELKLRDKVRILFLIFYFWYILS